MTEREFAKDVVRRLQEAGHQALWAGGCVRDEMLGLKPKDYDVATDAAPEQVRALFRRTAAFGVSFGVVEVIGPRSANREFRKLQVATFRTDGVYSDGRRPDDVVFTTAEEDAKRRDFTVNGMFYDPVSETLFDFVNGRADLDARILRAIGNPAHRFREDKLRLLRAVRMATRFDLEIEPETELAIREMAHEIVVVSAERIASELRELLVHPRRVRGVNLLLDLGLAAAIAPEIAAMKGLPQGSPQEPKGDLWDHVMLVLDNLGPSPSFPLALAALLHDVGKPRTLGRTPDRYTFYYHEHVGARIAAEICERLRLSNAETNRIVWLVEKHQYLAVAKSMRTSKLKQLLVHPGIEELLSLHRADAIASGRDLEHVEYCEYVLSNWSEDELNPAPLLTGHDLTRHGLEPGPIFKEMLDLVRDAQLDGAIKSKKEALALVDQTLAERT